MCGILAHVTKSDGGIIPPDTFATMLATLARRGPDDSSVLHRQGVSLGHRRLSIIDVVGGSQPVFNEDGDIACILNGEIYNFEELRRQLKDSGHHFRTQSDTEVVVHLYEEAGEQVFSRLTGMFAIVIADFRNRRLLVARDRLGEKPVYYVNSAEYFTCASEIKAFRHHPRVRRRIDAQALESYFRFGWVAGNRSILEGIKRLEPAHYLQIEGASCKKVRYWSPDLSPLKVGRAELCDRVVAELDRTMANKLISDVPLGVFLSGGLDSSAVVAIASRHSSTRLKTFSVGFGAGVNELPYARLVAERYDTEHTELIVGGDLLQAVQSVAEYYDEPFADSSSIPTYLISKAAREYVTVILTGDGGDELFAGYEGYARLRGYSRHRLLSKALRAADFMLAKGVSASVLDALYPLPGSDGAQITWRDTRSSFSDEDLGALLGRPVATGPSETTGLKIGDDPLSQAFEFDLSYYLPDDLLKKVDMASMASSLECRAPMLDHQLVELCLRIPAIEKVRGGQDKSLLREAMRPYLPAPILTREKQGFGAPLAHWLRSELREMVAELKSPSARYRDFIDHQEARRGVEQSMQELDDNWRAPLRVWTLLMFEFWLRYHL